MKKIISICLLVCILCTCLLSACARAKTPFETVNEAIQKTQALDSMAATMKMEMNMAMEGMTLSIPITAEIKATGLKSETPVISTAMSTSMLGQKMDIDVYQEGTWAYVSMEGFNYKMDTSKQEAEYDFSGDLEDMLQSLPEDLFKEIQLEKHDDGSVSVTIPIPEDVFSQIYGDMIANMNNTAGLDTTLDVKIENAVVKITVANNYISLYEMEFSMTMDVQGITTKTDVTASIEYTNPGAPVTITPPEGYQDFKEITP
jgi:hypothetical protein